MGRPKRGQGRGKAKTPSPTRRTRNQATTTRTTDDGTINIADQGMNEDNNTANEEGVDSPTTANNRPTLPNTFKGNSDEESPQPNTITQPREAETPQTTKKDDHTQKTASGTEKATSTTSIDISPPDDDTTQIPGSVADDLPLLIRTKPTATRYTKNDTDGDTNENPLDVVFGTTSNEAHTAGDTNIPQFEDAEKALSEMRERICKFQIDYKSRVPKFHN